MPFINWDSKYEFGIQEIDNQHKKLADLINKIYDAHNEGHGRDVLGSVFIDLVFYTKIHFNKEENYMEEANYPNLDEHRKLHRELTDQVHQLEQKYKSGDLNIDNKLLDFLKDWLTNHILKEDKKYVPYVKK